MTITVGTDTYISVADADIYVSNNFLSTDSKLIYWNALSDSDKEILLRKAAVSIDSLKFPGEKYTLNQTLAFPRSSVPLTPFRRNIRESYGLYSDEYYFGACGVVPDEIKGAQVEEAIEIGNPGDDTADMERLTSGSESWSLGSWSEKNKNKGTMSGTLDTTIRSKQAKMLLSRFKNGTYRIF